VLRADIYLGLLDGRWQHHTREQIITDLLTNATRATHDTSDSGADPDHPTEPDPATTPPTEGQTPLDSQAPVSDACGGAPTDTASAQEGDGKGLS
jgi:hypothetical protein